MLLHINHTTTYQYDAPIDYGLQQIRLTPKDRDGQKVVRWNIAIDGGKKELSFSDHHANIVDLVSVTPGRDRIVIRCSGEVEVSDSSGVVGLHRGFMPLWAFRQPTPLTQAGPQIQALVEELGTDFSDDISRGHALSALIGKHMPYETGRTGAETSAEQALGIGFGVCQDHAHVFLASMRLLGHPARYVSGYLMMNDRQHQDATHAWAETYMDGIGWVGFDVSNGYSPDDRYVRVATGLDYEDASPISGMRYGSSNENMVVQLQVQQ
ncbi:transglutaminase family protein [Emcibacter sp. SYSU 3D8]|uniref:transglutaminase family protein n=1 Tax=Emcibacter sp. SYSU 3D8 TaxID=3133969 RepID=UPI0031FEBEC0